MKRFFIYFIILSIFYSYGQLKFEPIGINNNNEFLFRSVEQIIDTRYTLFFGDYNNGEVKIRFLTVFPENVFYNNGNIYIQNRLGFFSYNSINNKVSSFVNIPNFLNGEEYYINDISMISISPDGNYLVGKTVKSLKKSDLYLYFIKENRYIPVSNDVDKDSGEVVCKWSLDSNYFIYQKDGKLYYFSINDYLKKRLLSEKFRYIGNTTLSNCSVGEDGAFYWVEGEYLYRSIGDEFYYRSIYKSYLRQGEIIGRLPFQIDKESDKFYFFSDINYYLLLKNGKACFYNRLNQSLETNPYIQLSEYMNVEKVVVNKRGNGGILYEVIDDGNIKKNVILISEKGGYKRFVVLNDYKINDIELSNDGDFLVISASDGVYLANLKTEEINKVVDDNNVLKALLINNTFYVFNDRYFYSYDGKRNILFLTQAINTTLNDDKIVVSIDGDKYSIDKETMILNKIDGQIINPNGVMNRFYRLMSKAIYKGFYKEMPYIKEIFSGKMIALIKAPTLKYKLYQPEINNQFDILYKPVKEKYEIALLFDCVKSGEGFFKVVKTLKKYGINASFFLNGEFIQANPDLTLQLSKFDFEIANMFEYNVNLLDNNFLIDKSFIRQGLSSNEEKYYNLTKKNFSPFWHTPRFVYSENIIKYGLESGYQYITFNLDSYDWVSKYDRQLANKYYMSNEKLVEKILSEVKPGHIILLNIGKNQSVRDEYLYNDIEFLVTELIRSGYSFTFTKDIYERYRNR